MIRANISEVKNRLSHYLRLVRGGEEIEIIDRKTPLARIVGIARPTARVQDSQWVGGVIDLGIMKAPENRTIPSGFISKKQLISSKGKNVGVLKALLEERENGR